MMEKGEAYFIGHCDLPDCDLGTFEYVCPECGKYVIDYENWWEEDKIYRGITVSFKCPECGEELIVEWNKHNHEFRVKHKKDI
jgi:predicted RNA-binding Zn-ribbon protein involved in translation (DUF1610 family)